MESKQSYTLHVMNPDKFTIPLCKFLKSQFKDHEHKFLFIRKPEDLDIDFTTVQYLGSPHKFHIISNTLKVFKLYKKSNKIIYHGLPILYYLKLFPWFTYKVMWVIYGGSDFGTSAERINPSKKTKEKYRILKKIKYHITHIEEESRLINQVISSNSTFIYSPMYLSNVSTFSLSNKDSSREKDIKILLGNSGDPSNHHIETLELLKNTINDNYKIFCPLSYGNDLAYIDNVIKYGKNMFGNKFVPMLEFMPINDYRAFLSSIDIAIFNHDRQQAMGVTISLLKLEKIIFMRSSIESYKSLKRRGFKILDINNIDKIKHLNKLDTSVNRTLVEKYYSVDQLNESWNFIYNFSIA